MRRKYPDISQEIQQQRVQDQDAYKMSFTYEGRAYNTSKATSK